MIRIALVHDYLITYGGAERVLETLHELFPKAPIYTAFADLDALGPHKARIAKWDIQTSWAAKIPLITKLSSPLRILAPFMWGFDFSNYDVVISSTNMYFAKNIKTSNNTIHICYCHTPPRSLWGYGTQSGRGFFGKIYEAIFNPYLRFMDKKAATKPDYFIANSQEVRGRIKRFYGRDATVINPPVNLAEDSRRKTVDEEYYLVVARLFAPKRVDLAIKAANKLKLPLKVVGSGVQSHALHKLAGDTACPAEREERSGVEFLGEVPDKELAKLYTNCKAVLFLARDEDFGIVPVEAMSFGKPVIGANSGGVPETVVDGKTGILVNEPLNESKVAKAIKKFEKTKWNPDQIRKHAKRFSKERFKREIAEYINSLISR